MHLQKWEPHWPRLACTSAPAPPSNQIDSKWRNSLGSGIAEIQDMALIRPQVKWVCYVVKRQDQLALLSQLHLNWEPSTKLSKQKEVTQLTTRMEKMDVHHQSERMSLKDAILMWDLRMLLLMRRSPIHSLSKTWKSSIKKPVLLHKMIHLLKKYLLT